MAIRDQTKIPSPIVATSQLLAEHRERATRLQRAIQKLTALAAHPYCTVIITTAVVLWISGNFLAMLLAIPPVEPPPFFWMQGIAGLLSLLVALLLVSTQRREAQLADRRDHLILEMVIQAERKSAKAIELLEEARRDNPLLRNRNDLEADIMSLKTDHVSVLGAIGEVQP